MNAKLYLQVTLFDIKLNYKIETFFQSKTDSNFFYFKIFQKSSMQNPIRRHRNSIIEPQILILKYFVYFLLRSMCTLTYARTRMHTHVRTRTYTYARTHARSRTNTSYQKDFLRDTSTKCLHNFTFFNYESK